MGLRILASQDRAPAASRSATSVGLAPRPAPSLADGGALGAPRNPWVRNLPEVGLMPRSSFGLTVDADLRAALEAMAAARGQSLNGLIRRLLERAVEDSPETKLDAIRAEALKAARDGVEAEFIAIRSVQETLENKIAALRSQKKAHEERVSELRRQLLSDPNGLAERLSKLTAELDRLERERETLGALLNEAERALDDIKTEFNAVEAKARQFFREAYEGPALDLLDKVVNATSAELERSLSLALRIVCETRALRTVSERIRLLRYIENAVWARIAMNSRDPSVVSFATAKNLSDSFRDWSAVSRFIREDFPERADIPVFEEALRKQGDAAEAGG